MNRKQRRAQEAQMGKDGNEELATKVALFGKLPEECTACNAAYDKNDKKMATTWNVVVREQERITLFGFIAQHAGARHKRLSLIF